MNEQGYQNRNRVLTFKKLHSLDFSHTLFTGWDNTKALPESFLSLMLSKLIFQVAYLGEKKKESCFIYIIEPILCLLLSVES